MHLIKCGPCLQMRGELICCRLVILSVTCSLVAHSSYVGDAVYKQVKLRPVLGRTKDYSSVHAVRYT
jgi:hypothetical protein